VLPELLQALKISDTASAAIIACLHERAAVMLTLLLVLCGYVPPIAPILP
jgi:hypothetical protein